MQRMLSDPTIVAGKHVFARARVANHMAEFFGCACFMLDAVMLERGGVALEGNVSAGLVCLLLAAVKSHIQRLMIRAARSHTSPDCSVRPRAFA